MSENIKHKLANYKKVLYALMLILVLADLCYSFRQHSAKMLDGDMPWNAVPSKDVQPILDNPLGIKAILEDTTYVNPNRFFCHWSFQAYLLEIPLLLQQVTDPIDSVYLSCGIARTLIQFFLILLLSMLITGSSSLLKFDFVLTAFIITCLFQTNGYNRSMGVIDESTTYAFFYALPAIFLLLYLIPFFRPTCINVSSSWPLKILWLFLAFVVCLSGPLNPGAVLIFCLIAFLRQFLLYWKECEYSFSKINLIAFVKQIPNSHWLLLTPIAILSLYSLFLGQYNSLTIESRISLAEMYSRIPEGIVKLFFNRLGYPILLAFLILNYFLIKSFKKSEGNKILTVYNWSLLFILLYILLLPLGGYREYRPYVLRNDTILPITLLFFFIYGYGTLFILKQSRKKLKLWYIPLLAAFIFLFTKADNLNFDRNHCEILALEKISSSKKDIVELNDLCTAMGWGLMEKPEESELQSELLLHWNIIDRKKLYYNKVSKK